MIQVAGKVLEQAAAYSLQLCPEEACGVFHGEMEPDGIIRINGWSPVRNVADNRTESFIFDKQQWADLLYKETESNRLVGSFHSHPSGHSSLSAADRRGLWPLPTCWIVSFSDRFRIDWCVYRRSSDLTRYAPAAFRLVDDDYA